MKLSARILIVFISFYSCSSPVSEKIVIGLSKNNNSKLYTTWLSNIYPEAKFIEFYNLPADSVEKFLEICNGILITGGNDVSPLRYGKEEEIEKCEDFDLRRDTLEFLMINYAIEKGIPLLGICRGEQILNVVNGGTLHTDIPTDIGNQVIHRMSDTTAYHDIKINESSLLYKICGVNKGNVNSIHHQAVDKLAKGYIASAISDDGVVEAIEPLNSKNFVLGVQWHPERLDSTNKLSYPIGKYFIDQAIGRKKLFSDNLSE